MVADGAEALRYYEAAEPFFAAALPPLHPVGGIRARSASPDAPLRAPAHSALSTPLCASCSSRRRVEVGGDGAKGGVVEGDVTCALSIVLTHAGHAFTTLSYENDAPSRALGTRE